VKNEIEIHEKSVEYIRETLSNYTEVYELDKNIKNPIIHMYPVEDTIDEEGNLNGYIDALFFRIHIYDPEKGTVYKGNKLHDGIVPFENLHISQIKIFKDLSTLICLNGIYNISVSFAAVDITKVK
jgi:hypothetical protein